MSADKLVADLTPKDDNARVDAADRLRESVAMALRLVGPPESAPERTPD